MIYNQIVTWTAFAILAMFYVIPFLLLLFLLLYRKTELLEYNWLRQNYYGWKGINIPYIFLIFLQINLSEPIQKILLSLSKNLIFQISIRNCFVSQQIKSTQSSVLQQVSIQNWSKYTTKFWRKTNIFFHLKKEHHTQRWDLSLPSLSAAV